MEYRNPRSIPYIKQGISISAMQNWSWEKEGRGQRHPPRNERGTRLIGNEKRKLVTIRAAIERGRGSCGGMWGYDFGDFVWPGSG
jgi:hypothetical protein